MSRRNEAAEAVKPVSAKAITVAAGHALRVLEGIGRVCISVEQSGARKLTWQPAVGRTHQIPEIAVFAALDAGDMDDRAGDGTLLSGWVTMDDHGQYVTAAGDVIGVADLDEDEDDEPTA